MASFNRIIMIGNLTRDPNYKQLSSGQAVCQLSLASNRQYKNKTTGSMVQEVCYVDIDVWGAQAESCRQYLQKGRPILVEGRLKFDTWEDPQGQTRSKHSIVADRVVFMSTAATAEFGAAERSVEDASVAKNTVDAQLEKELLDQIEQIKNKSQEQQEEKQEEATVEAAPKKRKKKQTKDDSAKEDDSAEGDDSDDAGGFEFKDEPPFEDELPF